MYIILLQKKILFFYESFKLNETIIERGCKFYKTLH